MAVKDFGLAPYVLKSLLNGVTRISTHQDAVLKINELTGASMAAWEK